MTAGVFQLVFLLGAQHVIVHASGECGTAAEGNTCASGQLTDPDEMESTEISLLQKEYRLKSKVAAETSTHSGFAGFTQAERLELKALLTQAADMDKDVEAFRALAEWMNAEKTGADPGELVVGDGILHDAAMKAINEISQELWPEEELKATGSMITAHMLQVLNNQNEAAETIASNSPGVVQGDMWTGGDANQAAFLLQLSKEGKRYVPNLWKNPLEVKYCFATNIAIAAKNAVKEAVQHFLNHVPCLGFKEVSPIDATKKCSEEPAIYIQSENDGCWANVGSPVLVDGDIDPNCVDSPTWKDPTLGDTCAQWVGYKCTGWDFSPDLVKNCPRACNSCPRLKKYSPSVMNLASPGCDSLGTAAHELGHNLGMLHEQERSDASQHIKILWENIKPTEYNQYGIEPNADITLPYDAMSLMHYADYYFNVGGGKKTMLFTGSSNVVMGNRMGLTYRDAQQASRMYGCEDQLVHFKLCTEKPDGCTREACSCGPSKKHKIQDGDCFRCMDKCPTYPSGNSGTCGCIGGHTKSCWTNSAGVQFCGCQSPCFDSTTYRDPTFGDNCAGWVGYNCKGMPISEELQKQCPKACKKCHR